MNMRERRIAQGKLIPDDQTNDRLERFSVIYWDAHRASDGFSTGWDSLSPGMREVVRVGVKAVLEQIDKDWSA